MMNANIAPVVGAVAMRARRRILRQFTAAGATSPDSAINVEPRRPLERKYLRSLQSFGAVRETPDGRLYLDEELLADHTSRRRKRVLGIGTAAILMGAIVAGLTRV
jgi:hypothetical protein